jgi:hypothetical protein
MTKQEIKDEIIETYGAQKQLSELMDLIANLQTQTMRKLMGLNELRKEMEREGDS